jgi:hypothetical protein
MGIFLKSTILLTNHTLTTSHTPDFYWAQRKDKLFLTIDVPNVDKNQVSIELTDDGKLSFKGRGGELHEKADYELHLELLHPIKAEVSTKRGSVPPSSSLSFSLALSNLEMHSYRSPSIL